MTIFACSMRAGEFPRCPDHDLPLEAQTVNQMVDQVLALPEGSRAHAACAHHSRTKGEHLAVFEEMRAQSSCGHVSTASSASWMSCPNWTSRKSIRLMSWLTASRSALTCSSVWRSPSKRPSSWPTASALIAPMDDEAGEEKLIFSARFALPAVRALDQRTGTQAVFIQQPGRCLSDLRWPRYQ